MAFVESNAVSSEETQYRHYRGHFIAICDSVADGPVIAATTQSQNANSAVPDRHSYYSFGNENDLGSFAGFPKATRRNGDPKIWDIYVDYSPQPVTTDDVTWDDPLDKPTEWSGSFAKFQTPLTHDRNDEMIVNAAADPFVPPAMMDDSRPHLVAKKNYAFADFDLATWWGMRDAVNSTMFVNLFPPRTVKIENGTWRRLFAGSATPYYEVTWTFEINFETFDFVMPNAGFNEIDANGEKVRITDDKLRDQANGALLGNGLNGTAKGRQLTVAEVEAGKGNFVTTRGYFERSFNVLGLPATIS